MGLGLFDYGSSGKRTLGIRDKQILYERAGRKCEACGKEISFTEMETGHKKAYSRGGRTTLKNSVCLCPTCNKLQGTDSFEKYMEKRYGKTNVRTATDLVIAQSTENQKGSPIEQNINTVSSENKQVVLPKIDKFQRKKELAPILKKLKVKQLKELCEEFGIRKPNSSPGGLFYDATPPSKSKYIKKILESDANAEQLKTFVSRYA